MSTTPPEDVPPGIYGLAPTPGGGWTPVPDPTKITSEAISIAKEDLRRDTAALRELIEARLDALGVAHIPDAIREQSTHLQVLEEVKLNSAKELLVSQLDGLLRLMDERAVASKEALAAALQAAKELVTQQNDANAKAAEKAELSFTKQIDQIATLIKTSGEAQDARLVEIKERIDRGEGQTTGAHTEQIESRSFRTQASTVVTGWIAAGIGFITTVALVITLIVHK